MVNFEEIRQSSHISIDACHYTPLIVRRKYSEHFPLVLLPQKTSLEWMLAEGPFKIFVLLTVREMIRLRKPSWKA